MRRTLLAAALALAAGITPAAADLFGSYNIPAGSMMPTYMVGDVVTAVAAFKREPRRGDAVIFSRDGSAWIKRIIALGGDRVQMVKGAVVLNGRPLARERIEDWEAPDFEGRTVRFARWRETLDGQSYETLDMMPDGLLDDTPEFRVPPGMMFVLGDNRDNSADSRLESGLGFVPVSTILGRPCLRILPVARAARLCEK